MQPSAASSGTNLVVMVTVLQVMYETAMVFQIVIITSHEVKYRTET